MIKNRVCCLAQRALGGGLGTRLPRLNHNNFVHLHTSSPSHYDQHTPNEGFEKQGSYEGHGKTTIRVLNEEFVGMNFIDSFSTSGFRLNDNSVIIGPTVIFPTAVLRWKVGSAQEITEESLSLFNLLEPKPDLVIIGHGELPSVRNPVDISVILGMKKKGIILEVLTTENAISTYNYLLEEGRVVAAALIPPAISTSNPMHNMARKVAQGNLYESDSSPFHTTRADHRRRLAYETDEQKKMFSLEDRKDKYGGWYEKKDK